MRSFAYRGNISIPKIDHTTPLSHETNMPFLKLPILQLLSLLTGCYGFIASLPRLPTQDGLVGFSLRRISALASSAVSPASASVLEDATSILQRYDQLQIRYMKDNPIGMGGGTSALQFVQTQLTSEDLEQMRCAIVTLVNEAHTQRAKNQSEGRIMLGICAENVDEALIGLKTWVPCLNLPRGLLHGMDVDGTPIPPEELGSVYVKYNTGGCMTFTDMRKTGMGFDALWRPGDAALEPYDGDFRGVYFNVELQDGEFRQFGVFPTDLFLEEEDW